MKATKNKETYTFFRKYPLILILLILGVIVAIGGFNTLFEQNYALMWPLALGVILFALRFYLSTIKKNATSILIAITKPIVQATLVEQTLNQNPASETENLPNELIESKIKELPQLNATHTNTNETLQRALAIKNIEVDFEQIYNRIFGTQISLLENLINNEGSLQFDFLSNEYQQTTQKYRTLQEWDFNQYLNFLDNNGLIIIDKPFNRINITEKGRAFIQYIRLDMKYAGYKLF